MKLSLIAAALGAALVLPNAAYAADGGPHQASGHYEWRSVPQFGPRAGGPVRKRVWVPNSRVASCDCAMMQAEVERCMHAMHPAAARSAG